jgi:hypothetical protein
VAIVTERQRDTAATQPAIAAGPNGAKACYCRSCAPLFKSPSPEPPLAGAGSAVCSLRSVAALLSPKSPKNRVLGCRPGWAWKWRYKRPKATLLAHAATYSRIAPSLPAFSCPPALDPSHIAPQRACWLFAGCLLVACWLLAGACWCLLIPARAS